MDKRIVKKISLSTLVLAAGIFFWSNANVVSTAHATSTTAALGEKHCDPGGPGYPACLFKKKDDTTTKE